jgi:hypothetical protein
MEKRRNSEVRGRAFASLERTRGASVSFVQLAVLKDKQSPHAMIRYQQSGFDEPRRQRSFPTYTLAL